MAEGPRSSGPRAGPKQTSPSSRAPAGGRGGRGLWRSRLIVDRSTGADGTLDAITARTDTRVAGRTRIGAITILFAAADIFMLVTALTSRYYRWFGLVMVAAFAVGPVIMARAYLRLRRHAPMLVVNRDGVTCWTSRGRVWSLRTRDIVSVGPARQLAARTGQPIRSIVVTSANGTALWADCVAVFEANTEQRAALEDLAAEIQAFLWNSSSPPAEQ